MDLRSQLTATSRNITRGAHRGRSSFRAIYEMTSAFNAQQNFSFPACHPSATIGQCFNSSSRDSAFIRTQRANAVYACTLLQSTRREQTQFPPYLKRRLSWLRNPKSFIASRVFNATKTAPSAKRTRECSARCDSAMFHPKMNRSDACTRDASSHASAH